MLQQIAKSTLYAYARNSFECKRNPHFNPYPATAAVGIYCCMQEVTRTYILPHLNEQDAKIQMAAFHVISFAASLVVSATLIRGFGHRSFSWVSDLTLEALFLISFQIAHTYKSQVGMSSASLANSFCRNSLEKMRNPQVDVIALTVPSAISTGVNYALSDRVAQLTGLDTKTVKMALSSLGAWALSAPVCSLFGREVVAYPNSWLAFALAVATLNEINVCLAEDSGEQ